MNGMTSNVELDRILQRYLPPQRVLSCATLPSLTDEKVERIKDTLKKSRRLFFPLFIRHHWIAGVLRMNRKGKFLLEIRDSAPSRIVHKDLKKALKSRWRELFIYSSPYPRQKPGSNDCGLFMAAAFFGDYLDLTIASPSTIGSRLRKLFAEAEKTSMDKRVFLAKMEAELLRREDAPIEGGAGRKRQREGNTPRKEGSSRGSPKVVDVDAETTPEVQSESLRPFETDIQDMPLMDLASNFPYVHHPEALDPLLSDEEESVSQVTPRSGAAAKRETKSSPNARTPQSVRDEAMGIPSSEMEKAHTRGIANHLMALGLMNVGDGQKRSLDINSVGMRSYRLKVKGKDQPRTVSDTLECHGVTVVRVGPQPQAINASQTAVYVAAESGRHVPQRVSNCIFVLGARPVTKIVKRKSFLSYEFTDRFVDATVGVYLPQGLGYQYPPTTTEERDAKRTPRRATEQRRGESRAQRGQAAHGSQSEESPKEVDEHEQIMNVKTTFPLNGEGSLAGGPRVCPRSWQVYGQRPPHISEQAWRALTTEVRLHHIRCIRSLKCMPYELLNQNIASAILEIVRRDAKQRRWKPSTVAKELAAYAGALRDLPLYTTESVGVILNDSAEWRAAVRTAKRLERQMDTDPPAPVSLEQYSKAVSELRQTSARAALFLSMMWALAARAGDVTSLRVKDVALASEVRLDGTVPLGIEQKYGKGTRFRGTYWPASTLHQEEASELRKAMSLRTASQRIFGDAEELKTRIRAALHRHNREAALPSVRKGAIRHLAKQGVSEEVLMRLMGHKRVETLYRYLGHSLPVTREGVAAQDDAARVHRPLPST